MLSTELLSETLPWTSLASFLDIKTQVFWWTNGRHKFVQIQPSLSTNIDETHLTHPCATGQTQVYQPTETSMCMNYPLLFLSLSLCLRCAIFHGMAGMYILLVGQFSSPSGLNQGPFFHYFVFFAKFALILALSVTFNWHIMQGHKQSIKCKKLHENAKIRNFCTYLGSISAPLQTIAAYLCVHLSRL